MEAAIAVLVVVTLGLAIALVHLRRDRDAVRRRLERSRQMLDAGTTDAIDDAIAVLRERVEGTEHDRAILFDALMGADLGIVIADTAGGVTYANPAAAEFIGARQGKAVAQVRARQLIDQTIGSDRPNTVELHLYTPVRRVLRLTARPIADGGVGVAIYIENLTEQRRIDAMRRDFVANVSHELKTPIGALSVLAETLGDSDDPIVRKRLSDRVVNESKRMARLIDDILDLSEIESTPAKHSPLDLGEVVAETRELMALRAEDAGVVLDVEPLVGVAEVVGDRQQLVSAVTNLVDNAIKYSAVGSPLGDPCTVRVRVYRDGADAVIEVRDDGIGIAERHLPRIFERFYRVDRARSRETGGTGLGLSIVRNIVRAHHGAVDVESREGVGSTFTIRLPLRGA